MVTSWSRRTEDLTCDKTDEKDAVLIARLTAQLRCYVPEPADETWARLRHLGVRREQLITGAGSQVQQMRDLTGVRLAGGPGRREAAILVGNLDGRVVSDRWPGVQGFRRYPAARCGPVRARGAA